MLAVSRKVQKNPANQFQYSQYNVYYLVRGMYGVCENITCHFVRVLRRPSLIFRDQKNQVVNIVFIKHSMGK